MELQKEMTPKSMDNPHNSAEMQEPAAIAGRVASLPGALRRIEMLQAEITSIRDMLRTSEEERTAKERLFRDTITREAELRREIFKEYNTIPDKRSSKAREFAFSPHLRVHAEDLLIEKEAPEIKDVPVVATARPRSWRREVPFQRLFASLFAARS